MAPSTTPRTIIMIVSINIISTCSLLLLLLLVLLLLLFLIVYHWDFPRARCQGARRGHLPPPLISGWLCCSRAPAGAPVGAPALHYNSMGLRRDRRRIRTLEGGRIRSNWLAMAMGCTQAGLLAGQCLCAPFSSEAAGDWVYFSTLVVLLPW